MKKQQALSTLLALSLIGCFADDRRGYYNEPRETPEEIVQDEFGIEGTRPLITLLAEYPEDVAESELVPGYVYHTMFASGPEPNVQDFFTHNSYGKFTISFQGVWGPYQVTNVESISSVFADALQAHEDAGHDLTQYDTNGDGNLTYDELMIVVIGNGGPWGGAVRPAFFNLASGFRIRTSAAIIGSHETLATIVHEASHLLGTWDVYGSNCNSLGLSVMSCTIRKQPGDFTSWLDPWHRMQLNWIEPRFVEINENESAYECFDIEAPQYRGRTPREAQRPLLLYNSERDPNEYLMVEFRNRRFQEPGFYSYEYTVPGEGVVVWSIRLGDDNRPFQVPSLVTDDKTDLSIWTLESDELIQVISGVNLLGIAPTEPVITYRRAIPRNGYIWGPGVIETEWQDGTNTGVELFVSDFLPLGNRVEVCVVQEGNPYVIDGGR